jgi:hypothetical protein
MAIAPGFKKWFSADEPNGLELSSAKTLSYGASSPSYFLIDVYHEHKGRQSKQGLCHISVKEPRQKKVTVLLCPVGDMSRDNMEAYLRFRWTLTPHPLPQPRSLHVPEPYTTKLPGRLIVTYLYVARVAWITLPATLFAMYVTCLPE